MPRNFLEGLNNKIMQKPQGSWCPDRDSNFAPSEYKSKQLPLHTRLLAYVINIGIYCIPHYNKLHGAQYMES